MMHLQCGQITSILLNVVTIYNHSKIAKNPIKYDIFYNFDTLDLLIKIINGFI